jgi:hypothetical protein
MGMAVRLEDQQDNVLEEIPDLESVLAQLFPSGEVTIFNHLQSDEVISELRRIPARTTVEPDGTRLDAVEEMTVRYREREHCNLKFLGDSREQSWNRSLLPDSSIAYTSEP